MGARDGGLLLKSTDISSLEQVQLRVGPTFVSGGGSDTLKLQEFDRRLLQSQERSKCERHPAAFHSLVIARRM